MFVAFSGRNCFSTMYETTAHLCVVTKASLEHFKHDFQDPLAIRFGTKVALSIHVCIASAWLCTSDRRSENSRDEEDAAVFSGVCRFRGQSRSVLCLFGKWLLFWRAPSSVSVFFLRVPFSVVWVWRDLLFTLF